MHIEHIFGDHRPFSQCHASTLLETDDGQILVAWFGGTRESHRDTAIWIAERSPHHDVPSLPGDVPGAAWSAPRVAARAKDAAHWNPVLFAPNRETIAMHFKVGRTIRQWETWQTTSADGGQIWRPPRPLVDSDRGGRGAVKNKPIQLRSGRWIAGASLERFRRWDAFIDRSPDGLSNWTASPLIPLNRRLYPMKGLIQPTLWESDNGCVHAYFRSTAGMIFESHSQDEGETWSAAEPTKLPNNNSGLDIVRLKNGLLALACNPVSGKSGKRTPLSVLFSIDEGRNWTARIDLEKTAGEYSYPAIIETKDGLAISYTWNRRRIAVAWLLRKELPALSA